MDSNRRHLMTAIALTLAWLAAGNAIAENYPAKPIRLIVPYPAGGITDVHARRTAERLAVALGQAIVVDNRPGASGTIGMAAAAKARPDGYTLVLGSTSNLMVSPALGMPIEYDPMKSFEPIALFGSTPMVLLAHPSLGVQNVAQLVAMAKAKPGALSYATGGATSTAHFAGEVFKQAAGVDLLHVPYKGSTPALVAVLANEVTLGIDFPDTCAPHVSAWKLRALLVTGSRRVAILPGVPNAVEAGFPELDLLAWGGFFAPAGTAKEIVERLNAELAKILRDTDLREQLNRAGWEVGGGSPQEFRSFIKTEQAKWARLVQLTGIGMEQ